MFFCIEKFNVSDTFKHDFTYVFLNHVNTPFVWYVSYLMIKKYTYYNEVSNMTRLHIGRDL